MDEEDQTPLAYKFRIRMHYLIQAALEDGTIARDRWDPDVLGFEVFGGDPMLQQNPSRVADIIGYEFGGEGVTKDDMGTIVQEMEARKYADYVNQGWGVEAQSEGGSNE